MKINQMSYLPRINSKDTTTTKNDSPFSIPDDAEIFRMKQKEKDRKRQQKTANANMKIWEKGVRKQGLTMKQLNELGGQHESEQHTQAKMSLIEAAKSAIKNRVKVNQPMHDFISKKRETLLFQMLIDHKRQKINEFEDLTRLHRKGLERAEQMLEEDMQAFNSYLNENKKEARDAIKKAEKQTREKNEKVAIIKEKLQIQADLTGKNMSKRETLQNLKKYKIFLQSLSPELSEDERRKRQDKIQKDQQSQQLNGSSQFDQLDDSDDQKDMYFRQPQQLISIFHSLQQSNLFLITHLKDMEQEIQQARGDFNGKKDRLTTKKNQLTGNKGQLMKQLSQVDQEIQMLKKTTNKDDISEYYSRLEQEIVKMSKEIGFVAADKKHISALELLKDIEKNIEEQLRYLKESRDQNETVIRGLERDCFTDKRDRKKKKDEKELEDIAKNQSQNPGTSPQRERRKGRPVMTRSIIKKEEKHKEIEVEEPLEEIERRKYLM